MGLLFYLTEGCNIPTRMGGRALLRDKSVTEGVSDLNLADRDKPHYCCLIRSQKMTDQRSIHQGKKMGNKFTGRVDSEEMSVPVTGQWEFLPNLRNDWGGHGTATAGELIRPGHYKLTTADGKTAMIMINAGGSDTASFRGDGEPPA